MSLEDAPTQPEDSERINGSDPEQVAPEGSGFETNVKEIPPSGKELRDVVSESGLLKLSELPHAEVPTEKLTPEQQADIAEYIKRRQLS